MPSWSYTDSDPGVIAHGRRDPGRGTRHRSHRGRFPPAGRALLGHPDTRRLIDFAEPAGLLIVAVTQFIPDADDPWSLVARYLDALAPGSYLALSAPTADRMAARKVDRILDVYATSTIPLNIPRTRTEIERFFTGLQIVPPYAGADAEPDVRGLVGLRRPGSRRKRRLPLLLRRRRPQASDGAMTEPAMPTIENSASTQGSLA